MAKLGGFCWTCFYFTHLVIGWAVSLPRQYINWHFLSSHVVQAYTNKHMFGSQKLPSCNPHEQGLGSMILTTAQLAHLFYCVGSSEHCRKKILLLLEVLYAYQWELGQMVAMVFLVVCPQNIIYISAVMRQQVWEVGHHLFPKALGSMGKTVSTNYNLWLIGQNSNE